MKCFLTALTVVALNAATVPAAEKWVDEFDQFSLERWTPQTSSLRLVNALPPDGVEAVNGVLTLLEPQRGVRLTSRDRFLYGTLEARVRISSKGLQYVGFMSRSPWGANTVMTMSMPTGTGWEMILSRDRKGGHAGFGSRVSEEQWVVLKIDWQPDRLSLDVDGRRIGEITDRTRIPSTPLPLILDTYARNRLEVDYLRISGTQIVKSAAASLPPAPPRGSRVSLAGSHWAIDIDRTTHIPTVLTQKFPDRQRWTPDGAAAVDVYVRSPDSNAAIRFSASGTAAADPPPVSDGKSRSSMMQPTDAAWRDRIAAELTLNISGNDMLITASFTALQDLDSPVEIGLGVPFSPDQWKRIAIPRLPWLELSPVQSSGVRLPFLARPDDATVTSDAGSWVHYPFGILQNETSSVFWGSMDIGKPIVLAPGNHGCGPAVTLSPKTWPRGERKRLSLRLRAFPRCTTEVVRWYLSNCVSSDPLTRDLFPVRDWTPRTVPDGGIGMPDIRISRVNPKADPTYFDRVTDMLKKYHVTNLWFGTFHNINGSYPTSGQWTCTTGLDVAAPAFKMEIARLKQLGLRPCQYTFQFIVPELCRSDSIPSRDWVLHNILGDLYKFDSYRAGEKRFGSEWFTEELARKIGSDVVTWANVDFGRSDVRDFYFNSITKMIEYYEPSGICFDYGWGVLSCNATHSPANPQTSQPHARLRVQADIFSWIRKHYPDMLILINDSPGTPSQLFASCQLVENSDVMSDLDLAAGRALASAMCSMDYFGDHDELRWARHAMMNLSRGCSLGLPFWIPMNGPDDYVNTLYDFSGRTTSLPIVPRSQVLTGTAGSSITGTVWAGENRIMAAAMNLRNVPGERQTTLTIQLPRAIPGTRQWHVTRLSNRVQPVTPHRWHVTTGDTPQLILQGPLGPGEMILLEHTEPAGTLPAPQHLR